MNANINDNSGGTNVIGNGVLFWGDVRSTKLTGDGIYEKSTGSQNLVLNAGDTQSLKNIDMNANDINNVKDINGRGGLNLLQVQNTNGLFYIDGGEIRMTADTSINLYPTANLRLGNAGQDISINPTTKTDHIGDLDMFDNEILQCNNIRTNTQPIFTINKNGSNATEIYGNSTIRRIQVSNAVYLLTGTNLECGTNDINDAGNVNISGSDNITFPIVIGTPSGALQVQNGGAYIKQDLQVDGAIYCQTINNIRPSGGVYSESAGTSYAGNSGGAERPLLNQGTSYGSLMVPAGGFTAGDTYAFKIGGAITCINNATFDLRICTNFTPGGGGVGETDFATINVQVDGAQTLGWWEVELEFIVRAVGGVGVGAISTNGAYVYFNNTDVQKGYGVNVNNTTTFDTTIGNDLQVGFFTTETAGDLSVFRLDQVSLTKLY